MKKILISVLIILLLILFFFAVVKGISFLKIKSIKGVRTASENLNSKFNEANELSNKTYPEEIEELEQAIKNLKISKKEFESKNINNAEKASLNTVEVKTYKIHYLWTILGNYRKDRGVQSLNLDLKSTEIEDVYDLQFTLIGPYTSITDFIYDIENDEELNFEIKDFTLSSETSQNTNTSSEQNSQSNAIKNSENNNDKNETNEDNKTSDGINLQAKFTVEDIGITLD